MIESLLLVKVAYWHIDEAHCKKSEVMKKTKMIFFE